MPLESSDVESTVEFAISLMSQHELLDSMAWEGTNPPGYEVS